jgi:hypothetical protein
MGEGRVGSCKGICHTRRTARSTAACLHVKAANPQGPRGPQAADHDHRNPYRTSRRPGQTRLHRPRPEPAVRHRFDLPLARGRHGHPTPARRRTPPTSSDCARSASLNCSASCAAWSSATPGVTGPTGWPGPSGDAATSTAPGKPTCAGTPTRARPRDPWSDVRVFHDGRNKFLLIKHALGYPKRRVMRK